MMQAHENPDDSVRFRKSSKEGVNNNSNEQLRIRKVSEEIKKAKGQSAIQVGHILNYFYHNDIIIWGNFHLILENLTPLVVLCEKLVHLLCLIRSI